MSSQRRHRDNLAPSLFPFLAVLLCTMGSLVLILMLIVSGAQADANRVAQEVKEHREELAALAEESIRAHHKEYEDRQFELEKQKLALQHLEEHIVELVEELKELEATVDLLSKEISDEQDPNQQSERLTELEQQLADAQAELEEQLQKPKNKKPIFAVIPYQGPNGTHRRPIYLECRKEGLLIQPEGVLLSTKDLQPPYGPGNPLDAALRTIRSEFKPENGAVTRTAYPLLLVRPSGIRTYALARAAMNGWDDQFGYELIQDDLELAFPDSKVGLHSKITGAIRLAKQRQASLMLAMPDKYQAGDFSPLAGDSSTRIGAGSPLGTSNRLGATSRQTSSRGMSIRDSSRLQDSSPRNSALATGTRGYGSGTPSEAFSTAERTSAGGPLYNPDGTQVRSFDSITGTNTSVYSPDGANGSSAMISRHDSPLSQTHPGAFASGVTDPSSARALASPIDGAGGQVRSGSDTGTGSSADPNLNAMANSQRGSGPASSGSSTGAYAQSAASQQDSDQGLEQGPQLSMSFNTEQASPNAVAQERGRNWAWSAGPRSQTPVVRALHLHCFSDRWILLPERGQPDDGTVIPFTGSPEQRAVRLAEAVRARVDDWGMALSGGYWKPKLVVDVAPAAEWRYNQLVRLLEGSGIELERRTARISSPSRGGVR